MTTTVQVTTAADATDTDEGYERRISTQEVERSAGTFGDPGRFMQTLPGVVSDNDERNDFIVRGGNPAETLFVVAGVPDEKKGERLVVLHRLPAGGRSVDDG